MPSSSGSSGSSSSRPAPKVYYPSSGSQTVTETTKYRSGTAGKHLLCLAAAAALPFPCQSTNKGSAGGFYTTIKDVPSSRGGPGAVVIQKKK